MRWWSISHWERITPLFGVNLSAACTVPRIFPGQIVMRLALFVLVVFGCLMIKATA